MVYINHTFLSHRCLITLVLNAYIYEYTRLRQELLGIDDLKMYDLYTPLVKDVKFEMPYEEAKSWIHF
jgi:oligoendopeptidase F